MDSNQHDHTQPNPMDAESYFEQSIDYRLADDYEQAIALLNQALQLSPTNAKFYYNRATVYFIKSDWNEAIADYTEALRLKPDPSDDDAFNFTIDEVYRDRGIAYQYIGNYDQALADFAELIRLQPDNPLNYRDRSVIYKLKGDFENSFADVNTLQRLDPTDPTALTLLADLQIKQGDKSAAMRTYTEQVERFGSPASYFHRAQLWKEQGEFALAIADFEEAIRLYPQYDSAYLELGETYRVNGDYTKSIDVLNKIIERQPGYRFSALLLRAKAHLASGDLEQASHDFDETVEVITEDLAKYPTYTQGYVNRGHAHAARNRVAEAVADYKKALELEPTHREAATMHEFILKNS